MAETQGEGGPHGEKEEQEQVLDMTEEQQEKKKDLKDWLKIPNLALVEILNYVGTSTSSLKKLRALCKTTKSWVDECPLFLEKLPLYVANKKRRDIILQSSAEWSHIVLNINPTDDAEEIIPFLTRMQGTVRNLKIRLTHLDQPQQYCERTSWIEIHKVLAKAPNLESLTLEGNMFSYDPSFCNTWLNADDESLPLCQLQNMDIQMCHYDDRSLPAVRDLTLFFMRCAKNLISIKFPIGWTISPLNFVMQFELNFPFLRHQSLTPSRELIQYLQIRKARLYSQDFHTLGFKIDFCSETKYFPSTKNAQFLIQMPKKDFLVLAKAVEEIDGDVYNVPCTSLPLLTTVLTPHEHRALESTVRSVIAINFMVNDLNKVAIPDGATVKVVIRDYVQTKEEREAHQPNHYRDLELPDTYNIISMNIHATGNAESEVVLFDKVLPIRRSSLLDLEVRMVAYNPGEWLIGLNDLYPNLTKLDLSAASGVSFVWPNEDMRHLQDLTLSEFRIEFDILLMNVYTAHDWADFDTLEDLSRVRGPQLMQPFIFTMKRLVHLRLLNVDARTATDHVFRHLFSHMKPKTFIFRTKDAPLLSLKQGISSLATDNEGVFGFKEFVEHFECCCPRMNTPTEMERLLENFTNLKSSEIYYLNYK